MSTADHNPNPPSDDEIIAAVAQHWQAPEAVALSWLARFQRTFDPRAAQERLAERNEKGRS